jgi:hypothetical protein
MKKIQPCAYCGKIKPIQYIDKDGQLCIDCYDALNNYHRVVDDENYIPNYNYCVKGELTSYMDYNIMANSLEEALAKIPTERDIESVILKLRDGRKMIFEDGILIMTHSIDEVTKKEPPL